MKKKRNGVENKPSISAQGAAFLRAVAASEFKDGVWGSDYLAENFLNPNFVKLLRIPNDLQAVKKKFLTPGMYNYNIARTVFFDRVFKEALYENYPQIVFLGAGYDTRAYRFHNLIDDTKIFELDIQTTQQRKKEYLLKANIPIPNQLAFVAINFNTDSIKELLLDAGYNTTQKTLFIWEGVTYYLPPDAVDKTLNFIKLNSPPDTHISFDYSRYSGKIKEAKDVRDTVGFMKSVFSDEPTFFKINEEEIESFLSERGFKIIEHYTPKDIEKSILTSEDGFFLGQTNPLICFVLASVS